MAGGIEKSAIGEFPCPDIDCLRLPQLELVQDYAEDSSGFFLVRRESTPDSYHLDRYCSIGDFESADPTFSFRIDAMKRSNEPIFWSLFGAGGMLSALIGVVLVFVTGIGVPLALLVSSDLMQYQHMLGFAQHWLGKIIVFSIISLFLWHAALRILNMMHDFGVHAGMGARTICYGLTFACTIATAYWLLII